MATDSEQNDTDGADFSAINENMEGYVIAAHPNNGIAFRFGPFTNKEIGEIITKCVELEVKPLITFNCGNQIDWNLMRDMCYAPALPEEQEAK